MKPDERVFRHALEKFETTPERTVYIGDKIHKDVRGANSVGMVSILLRRGYNAFEPIVEDGDRPDIEVRSFYELMRRCKFG